MPVLLQGSYHACATPEELSCLCYPGGAIMSVLPRGSYHVYATPEELSCLCHPRGAIMSVLPRGSYHVCATPGELSCLCHPGELSCSLSKTRIPSAAGARAMSNNKLK